MPPAFREAFGGPSEGSGGFSEDRVAVEMPRRLVWQEPRSLSLPRAFAWRVFVCPTSSGASAEHACSQVAAAWQGPK
eukprot:3437954-Pyramimonas_sp.AAC.1